MAPVIPPVGQEDKREDDFEVEILYMHRQVVEGGDIYDFEMHFLSDHSVIQKSRRNGG